MVTEREERLAASPNGTDAAKTELVLAGAGLKADEIAPLVGKQVGAVRKAIERARKKR